MKEQNIILTLLLTLFRFVCVDVDAEAQQLARVEEKKAETRRRKNEKKAQSMQWEAMKPVMPAMETETEEGGGGDETMDLDDAIRNTRRTGRRLQGGKLLGCRVKKTKKQREKQKKKLKRSKRCALVDALSNPFRERKGMKERKRGIRENIGIG